MNLPPVPAGIPPVPEGYVYLGFGRSFHVCPNRRFIGRIFDSDTDEDWGLEFDDVSGNHEFHYCAPLDSEIVRLNFRDPVKSELIAVVEKLVAWDKKWPKFSDNTGESESELNAICAEANAAISRAEGGGSHE